MWEKLKSLLTNDQVFYSLLVLLVALGSFALGQASLAPLKQKLPDSRAVLLIASSTPAQKLASPESKAQNNSTAEIVASRSGTKYHLPNCPGAQQIKEENKIYFTSQGAAAAAGYTKAANCPGLK